MPEISGMIQNYLEGSIATIGRQPVIQSKSITENGTYTAPEGVDGYSPITVNVPIPEPSLAEQVCSHNGTYLPPEGYDGFSKVEVDVPIPTMNDITITENGTYLPASYNLGGFDQVVVNVPEGLSYDGSIFEDGTINTSAFYFTNYNNTLSDNKLVYSGSNCGVNITCKTNRVWVIDIEFDNPNFASQLGVSNYYDANTNTIIGSGVYRVVYGSYTITSNHLLLSGFGNFGAFVGGAYNDSSVNFTVKSIKYKLF